MFSSFPEKVNIVEVGPRDGLQSESNFVSTENKIKLIDMLSKTGLPTIEVTAFVHPKWSPKLADSYEVATSINKLKGVNYTALIPNLKGLERAISSGLKEVAISFSASESHSKKNLNRSINETFEVVEETIKQAKANNIKTRAYLSTVFGCPYEGNISIDKVTKIVKKLLSFGVYQISLGDTIGIGNPKQVQKILTEIFKVIDNKEQIALHFHDTRGLGLANSIVGLSMGITTFDSSIGGLGGCQYAPGASGNISTEDLVNMLHSMGIKTGVDLNKLVECNLFMKDILGKELNSKYAKAYTASHKISV